jgi:deoxycytidylate deaminase
MTRRPRRSAGHTWNQAMRRRSHCVRAVHAELNAILYAADHEHDFAPEPLGGDFTCVSCGLAAFGYMGVGPG